VRLRLRAADAELGRSTVYVNAKYHPSGKAGWFTKPNPKNGDWRRFAISKQMCQAVQEHIEEYGLGPGDLLFPQWMFAYVRPNPIISVHPVAARRDRLAMCLHLAECGCMSALRYSPTIPQRTIYARSQGLTLV
jgi:hypothetical protein